VAAGRAPVAAAVLAVPYGRLIAAELRRTRTEPRGLPGLLAANVLSDLTLLTALAWGSARARCVVI